MERRLPHQPENAPQTPPGMPQDAEKMPPSRWWPVYTVTLLYVAAVILLLDWLTRHFHP